VGTPYQAFDEANDMMANDPNLSQKYKKRCRHTNAIKHAKGTYFFDYGNAFY
jgi:urocanate hydratase